MLPDAPAPESEALPQLQPVPAAKTLACPSCGGGVTVRAAGYSVTVVCQYCASVLDVSDPIVKLITENHRAAREIAIPLGTRGTLRGVEWETIGYLARSENGTYGWEEFLLFNPYHGYRWLIYNRGGWSLGETRTEWPTWQFGELSIDGAGYKPFFANGSAQVDYVAGEFYWRVTAGETVSTDDWVRPGFMLSREANAHEVSWTVSELLSPREIRSGFGVASNPAPWPPLPHQPSPHGAWLSIGWKVALAALVFLIGVSIVFGGSSTLVEQTLEIPRDGREASATIGPITLYRPYQKVEIKADVPGLSNGWVDLDYSLVNRATQQSYDAYGAAEQYSGVDSDGRWSEGSGANNVSVASVPAGTYDVVVEYKGNRWTGASEPSTFSDSGENSWVGGSTAVTIRVSQGALFFSNFLIALILIVIPLIWVFFRHVHFEQARQAESDFAPTGLGALGDDDEDDD
ncbi:DUF4178 domain-containing protein [Sphingomonas sp. G-3-2-10]|uniref:DUF4178 domain-containing protein n=1 Tax=Sphingomonas sp. G-3-2-10 TaxID=2728838 RepID=UPI00146D146A|nr:DUF4178 domain-containing protein [Sphingomonas sp. G-3-2-10]NML07873.1 DUF4178 domain-containing protein [Sphingomonas sp. G-3-2-10]